MKFFKIYACLDSFTLGEGVYIEYIVIQAVCLKEVILKVRSILVDIDCGDNEISCITTLKKGREVNVFTRFDVVNNQTIKNEYPS